MRYRAKPLEIDVVELRVPIAIKGGQGKNGEQRGNPGDFLVTYPNGGQAILTAGQLAAGFEPMPNEAVTVNLNAGPAAIETGHRGARAGAPSGRRGMTRGLDAATLTKMRQQWEAGAKVDHIAKACGVSVSCVYHYSSKGKWKRGKPTKGGPGLTAGKTSTPATNTLAGRVRCPHCQEWTETDPCTHCKKRMAKW